MSRDNRKRQIDAFLQSAGPEIDPTTRCSDCTALCCRYCVVLDEGDTQVPRHLTTETEPGVVVMTRGSDGFCVALLPDKRCGIYEQRPSACRRFATGGRYCRAVQEEAARNARLARDDAMHTDDGVSKIA